MPKVPADIYATAKHVWVTGESSDEEFSQLTHWAKGRWPIWIPKDAETLAFWIISIAIQDGVEG